MPIKPFRPGEPASNTPTHEGYRYHATSIENAHGIASEGLRPHKPWHGTDQRAWPDGGTERRSYFTDKAHVAAHFAPEQGKAVLLRAHKDRVAFQTERGTGDMFVREPVAPDKLEIMDHAGSWHPLSTFSGHSLPSEKFRASGNDESGSPLHKSSTAPFQPSAPHPSKPRAPRRPTPYDPVAGKSMFAAPFKFKPHRLGDLWELHQQDKYSPQKIKKVAATGAVPPDRQSVKAPTIPQD